MRILVTGGAGFIGSHVADAYVALGHEVAALDDLSTGARGNVNPKAEFIRADIRDGARLREVFAAFRPEVVNHHAAQSGVPRSVENPEHDAAVNAVGTANVLEAARRAGVRRAIYAATGGAVYGNPTRLPVGEDRELAPVAPYGATKLAGEYLTRVFAELYGFSYAILRYPNVYGPRQDPKGEAGVVAIFAERMLRGERCVLFGDGRKTRDYLYVADVARANVLALEKGAGVYNLGWGREVSDREIFDAVAAAAGVRAEPETRPKRPGEIDRIALDASRARWELGWAPETELARGVALSVAFYRKKLGL